MKKIVFTFSLTLICSALFAPAEPILTLLTAEPALITYSPQDRLNAIIWVESGNNGVGAYNRNEPQAKGILQQWPIFVDDCNKIVGYEKFKLCDRLIPKKAIEMFWIYQKYYNPTLDFEKMCRIQCGGPDGPGENCTLGYFELVKKRLCE